MGFEVFLRVRAAHCYVHAELLDEARVRFDLWTAFADEAERGVECQRGGW